MEIYPPRNAEPVETGIHSLPDELLCLISSINGDMFSNNDALTDTRYTSQVCHRWRQILLERPFIWGRLIDLNALCKVTAKEEWGNEVLRRSQGAFLWIRGSVMNKNRSRVFFEHLIYKHWPQIQKLVVYVPPFYLGYLNWQIILQPAPGLETFQIQFYNPDSYGGLDFRRIWRATSEEKRLFSRFPQDARPALFSNNAPSLRKFLATQIYFSVSAPWLSNLRSVSFSSPITLHKTFQAIQQMPLLECLNVEKLQYTHDKLILPHLSFTRLTDIVLADRLDVCFQVLNHITPAAGCSLSLSARARLSESLTTQILIDANEALLKYLKIFHRSHPTTQIALLCRPSYFKFTDTSPRRSKDGPFFKVSFLFGPETLSSPTFPNSELTVFNTLISIFTIGSASFPFVRTLDLHLVVPTLYTSFLSTSQFFGVEVLSTDEPALTTILQLKGQEHDPPSEAFPFPALKTLRLREIQEPNSIDAAHVSPFIHFLNTCRNHGSPISVLEVYPRVTSPRLGYLRPFGRILDQDMVSMTLKVLSLGGEGREVVCGGGNIQRLLLEY
ncbi:hypothetical protein GALMADRAFT_237356 [Galerina marginata CBS 339.88]|uniref:Uncharacterized protein n=1 Tax=Galerina marginata (strain CBS 339.88) TaxID=685588 RepID=A0A067TX13_GALM3|nr:hypothetical protein GALMADRAFT_237356 [Galerina marginata CBS 339.88]